MSEDDSDWAYDMPFRCDVVGCGFSCMSGRLLEIHVRDSHKKSDDEKVLED